ncbi:hypothetical protein [Tepidimonas taiwanensis]|uniref:hypothetical protein n=1 Tax=Tepidimonas taiwanensis TaxID=307486 RepID=UPI0005B9AE2A|nr:hypothetical protein [Tepidimonas taiwanensis]
MSLRDEIEAAIRWHVEQVAVGLVGDLWGNKRLAVLYPRLALPRRDTRIEGQVEVWLLADTPDQLPTERLARACIAPFEVTDGAQNARLWLSSIEERVDEMKVAARLLFDITITEK